MGAFSPWSLLLVVLAGFPAPGLGGRCDRLLIATLGSPKSPLGVGDYSKFEVSISGDPEKYVPGETYRVRVQGTPFVGEGERENRHSFAGFMLTVDAAREGGGGGGAGGGGGGGLGSSSALHRRSLVGNFSLYGDTLAKFDERCPHAVTHTSTIRKTIVEVQWTAPVHDSGCVVFRALVIEQGDKWYADERPLIKELCEEMQNLDQQPPVNEECCACEEAKYEVTFEGLWSRNTHPKHFPPDMWLTRFSDVIGASHDVNYRFWEYNGMATDGLRELAERGSTRLLESELKDNSEHIRTIIKARGIGHPNVTGLTFAVFRVDRKNHLISLVSMLEPSPDWIVGVSALELCLANCSWAERKTLNLYPWDAGTDSGLSYLDPDRETVPQEPIRRITESFPNDDRSPFFDPDGREMKPVARLTIMRQRLYEKSCETVNQNEGQTEGCEVSEWGEWSPCNPPCGRHSSRLRQRSYLNPEESRGCGVSLSDRRPCYNLPPCNGPHMYGRDISSIDDANCETTPWGRWSSCTPCTHVRTRQRKYKYQGYAKSCSAKYRDKDLLVENSDECDRQDSGSNCYSDTELSDECQLTEWTQFSSCSVSCGEGTQERTRRIIGQHEIPREDTIQSGPCKNALVRDRTQCHQSSCDLAPHEIPVVCRLPADTGPCRADIQRWFFSPSHHTCLHFQYGGCRGNRNNFKSHHECEQVCRPLKEQLSAARTAAQEKFALEAPGAMSHYSVKPSKMAATDDALNSGFEVESQIRESSGIRGRVVDCQLSHWSEWSPCDKTCGAGHRSRSRDILETPYNGGLKCSQKLLERRRCKELPPCIVQKEEDCQVTNWSRWSECSASCGDYAFRQRSRIILRDELPGGKPCGPKTETQKCFSFPCPPRQ